MTATNTNNGNLYTITPNSAFLGIEESTLLPDAIGTIGFVANKIVASETSREAVAIIERRGGTSGAVVIQYTATTDASHATRATACNGLTPAACDGKVVDYWAVSRQLRFDSGVKRQIARVPLIDDSKYESSLGLENFLLTISVISGDVQLGTDNNVYNEHGSLHAATTVYVLDEDDVPGTFQFTSTAVVAQETSRYVILTVTRTNGASGKVLVEVDEKYFRPAEVELLLGDPRKAEKELRWKRKVSFKELVSEMVKYDLENEGYVGRNG